MTHEPKRQSPGTERPARLPAPVPARELRRKAERKLSERPPDTSPGVGDGDDARRLVHELQVHQVELEMQNEELRKARDEVEAGLARYRDLDDFAPVGYLALDRAGTIREADLTAAGLLGTDRTCLPCRRLGLFVATVDRPAFADFLARVFQTGSRQSCELTLLGEASSPVDVRLEAVMDPSGQECRVALTDVTERRRAETDRLILNKLESTGILAGGIAHDFNNLLTIILLDLEAVHALVPPGPESVRWIEDARARVLAARALTQQFITFANGTTPVRVPVPLSGLLRESARLALSGSRVWCDLSLADDLWMAHVDASQIGQVIHNLVLNAREAMPEGGTVLIHAENRPHGTPECLTSPPGDGLQITISDQGVGMAKDLLPRIFDPYFSTKRRGEQKGMGLGLTVCHSIIHSHGGTISVQSEVGVGSVFRIVLPAHRRSPEPPAPATEPIPPKAGRILVMDDEEGIRRVLDMALRRMGHDVELVADGQRAVEAYQAAQAAKRPFDVVLLDLTVRIGVGGKETIRLLRGIDPSVKAILVTGYTHDPAALEPEQLGFRGFLPKPFDSASLARIIARIMNQDR